MSVKETEFRDLKSKLRSWDNTDLRRATDRFDERRSLVENNATGRRVAAALAAAAILSALFLWVSWKNEAAVVTQPQTPSIHEGSRDIAMLADGSEVHVFDNGKINVLQQTDDRVELSLEAGKALFSIIHRPERTLSVTVGPLRVTDIGTQFVIERHPEYALVEVREGEVQVTGPGVDQRLVAGQSELFSLRADAQPASLTDAGATSRAATDAGLGSNTPKSAAASTTPRSTNRWREYAKDGKRLDAWLELSRLGLDQVPNNPSDLLLGADLARVAGEPAAAATLLERVLRSHAADPRAPTAAFNLGLIRLQSLRRPAAAAAAFKLAERSPNLAEEAMAQTVRSWLNAGQTARAQVAFQRYQQRFPSGRQIKSLSALLSEQE